MFKENEYIIYRKEVCKVKEIKEVNGKENYVLCPVDDNSLIINAPSSNETNIMRKLATKKEIESIINAISKIETIDVENDKMIEKVYKDLFNNGEHRDLIKIIKTTYLRNQDRIKNKKKIGEKDEAYFKKAEKLLYNEFSIVLGMSYDDAKNYVIDKVNKMME